MDKQSARYLTQLMGLFLTATLMVCSSTSHAQDSFVLPNDYTSRYSIFKFGTQVGEIKNQFSFKDNQINYTSLANAKGFASLFLSDTISEVSKLTWDSSSDQALPKQTSYILDHSSKSKKNQKITFEYTDDASTRITSMYKNKTFNLVSASPVWGRQLIPILMSSALLKDKDTKGSQLLIANKGKLKNYTYSLIKAEPLPHSGKTINTLLFKIQKENSSRFSYAWLSAQHQYLPVKIEQYKDDKLDVSMKLIGYKLLN